MIISREKNEKKNCVIQEKVKTCVIPPGIEPGTLSVLDSRDNRYTMESHACTNPQKEQV